MYELEFIEYLKNNFVISFEIRNKNSNKLENIYFHDRHYCYAIATPHSGNNYKYLVRKNDQVTFDRWSNCDEEYYFDNYEQIIDFLEGSE